MPKFGEWFRGVHASESNPHRDGMFVKVVRRTGRVNAGVWYQLTDGRGSFWEYRREDVVAICVPIEWKPDGENFWRADVPRCGCLLSRLYDMHLEVWNDTRPFRLAEAYRWSVCVKSASGEGPLHIVLMGNKPELDEAQRAAETALRRR